MAFVKPLLGNAFFALRFVMLYAEDFSMCHNVRLYNVCMYVYIYIYTYTHTHTHTHIYICIYTYIYVYTVEP